MMTSDHPNGRPLADGRGGRKVAPSHRGLILLALCLAALIINIDVTIVNVTLPSLVRELGATTTNLQWVVDAYTLVFASLILAAGSLSDRVGRKGLLLVGLGVFAAGSLAGSFASTPGELIAARAFMGIGAAAIFPSTLSLIANVFTERKERAKAIGLWGATTGVGVATGPIVGGWLLGHFWWGSVFLFMVPVAGVVAASIAWAVPTSRDPSTPPIDWRGLALSTAGMGALILSIIQAPSWGWGSARTLGTIAAGLLILAAFVNVERRMARPMLDVKLFRNPRFTAASGSITIGFFALSGFTFLITQYFQFVRGYTALGTGVRILPVATSIAVAAVLGTRLAVGIGNKAVVASGLLAFGAALLWIAASASQTTPYATLVGQMIVAGGGLGLITAPATEAIMGVLPKEKAGVGSAVNDATRLFGAALGVAVIGSIAASLYASRLGGTIPQDLPLRAALAAKGSVGGALVAAQDLGRAGLAIPGHALTVASIGAFLHSLTGSLRVAGAVALGGAAMAAALLPSRPGTTGSSVETKSSLETPSDRSVRPVPPRVAEGWSEVEREEAATSKFIMVTGASSGIGRATAGRFADAGHVVFAAAPQADALEAFAAEHRRVIPVVLDVTDAASIERAREQVWARTRDHGLDVLVNSAGILVLGPVEAVPDEQTRAQFEVNLFGSLAVTRAFVPPMRERGAGRIVNVSSILGRFVLPGSGLYSASKFALEAWSDALRMELAPFGVLVVLVEPGVIDTPLYATAAASLSHYEDAFRPYRSGWPAGFGFPERLLKAAAPVDGIATIVVKAALGPNPRARYRPGVRNRMNARLLTTLPTRSADRIKSRIAGIAKTSGQEMRAADAAPGVAPTTSHGRTE